MKYTAFATKTFEAEWGKTMVGDFYVTTWKVTRSGREEAETEFFGTRELARDEFDKVVGEHTE